MLWLLILRYTAYHDIILINNSFILIIIKFSTFFYPGKLFNKIDTDAATRSLGISELKPEQKRAI